MSINDFVKAFKEVFPEAEYKATKDGQIHKSKGWLLKNEDVLYREVTPHTPPKKNGDKTWTQMSYIIN